MRKGNAQYWLIAALMCGLAGGSIGICSNTVGVFYAPASEALGVLRGSFAMHSTLSLIATGLISLWVPSLMKMFPYKLILAAALIASAGSTVFMGMSSQIWQFNILGIIRGIGAGCFAGVPVTMIINYWFEKKNGFATSLALSFSGVVGAICQPVLTGCISSFGWRMGYFLQAAILTSLTLPALLLPFQIKPQLMGLEPYGHDAKAETTDKQADKKAYKSAKNKAEEEPHREKLFTIWNAAFLVFCLMTFLHTNISGIGQHMHGLALNLGFSAGVGAVMASTAMIGNIVSKLLIGILADIINPLKASFLMIGINFISMFVIMFGGFNHSMAMMLAGAFIYGTVYSVGAVGIALLTRYFFGSKNYSTVYSKVAFLSNLGASVSLSLIGYVFDFTGSYDYVLIAGAIINLVNIAFLLFVCKKQKAAGMIAA